MAAPARSSLIRASGTAPAVVGGTREQILRAAREFIVTRSYLGFSFQDLADAVGIRKASLYHHFPTKEALGVEVLHEARRQFEAWVQARPRPPAEALKAYIRMYRQALRPGEAMCPAGAMAPGWGAVDVAMRGAVQALRDAQVLWLTGVLAALRPEGDAAQAARQAAFVFAACQGAMVVARMTGRAEDFDAAVAQLESLLDA